MKKSQYEELKKEISKLKQVVCNEIKHEMKWHRYILLVLFALAVAKLFT